MFMTLYCLFRNRKTLFKSRVFGTLFSCMALSAGFLACQIYQLAMVQSLVLEGDATLLLQYFLLQEAAAPSSSIAKNATRAFGACIMVKDDETLLYEWLAYHYTVLPLGFVVVGSDIGNTQDPSAVLNRWATAGLDDDLHHWILQPNDFIHRHGNYTAKFGGNITIPQQDDTEQKAHHHHALVYRQKGFLTACSEILKKNGVGWTVYFDSDEFVALNPFTPSDEALKVGGKGHFSITNTSRTIRREIISANQNKTVLDVLMDLQRSGYHMPECYTTPRLLVGALENRSCPHETAVEPVQQLARAQLGDDKFDQLSTLRFFQHAAKGDFSASKYGKVFMDLTKIPNETIQSQEPRNIHRPFKDHCGAAGGAHFPDAYFFLMHYIGSYERYSSRSNDQRRNRDEWEQRAFVDAGNLSACASYVHTWYPRFLAKVGKERALMLLGG